MYTKKTNKKPVKRLKKSLKRHYKTIIRENNLTTLYVLSFLLAVLFVFPIIVNYLMLLTSLVVVSSIGLIGYVVVNRSIDYRNRSLPERLIQSLPDSAYKYRSTSKVLTGSNQAWKLIEPSHQIEATEDVIDIEPIPTVKQISLTEAIKQSNPESWLIGQNETSYCDINIRDLVHIGLIGKTGSGKTASSALLLMIHALKNGFQVIALDGKSGVDWSKYGQYIEAYSTDYLSFPNQIDQLCALHDSRMMEVKNHDVSNIDELPNKLQHVLVICEEYGHVCQALQAADRKSYSETISKMSNLMRVSRSTGIHFLLIDQLPNHWEKTIKANLGGLIGYRIKGQLANGFGMYKLGELKPVGQFCYDDGVYDAWFTKAEIGELLKRVSMRKISLLKEVCSEAAQLKDVVVESTLKDNEQSIAALAAIRQPTTLQPTTPPSTPPLPKAVSNRLDFVNQLIDLAQSGETLNDSKVRRYCKELTGKSLDGVASKTILDWVNTHVNSQNNL